MPAEASTPRAPSPRSVPARARQRVARRYQAIIELAPDATVVADSDGRIRLVNRQTEALFGYAREELLGQPVEQLIPERFRQVHQRHRTEYAATPRMRSMGAALQPVGRRRDGSEFPVAVNLAPLDDGGASFVIASIRDISELRQMQALTDTALSHLALEDLLRELLGRICLVMDVEGAAILLLDKDGQQLTLRAARGLEDTLVAQATIPVGQGFAGRVAASRAPLIVNDLSTFEVFHPQLRQTQRSAIGVPLLVEGRLLGIVYVGSAVARRFTERDVALLQRGADRIALAIDRAQLFAAEQATRTEAERQAAQLEATFEAIADGVTVFDARGRIVRENPAQQRLLGLDAAPPDYAALPLRERMALFAARDAQGRPLGLEEGPLPRVLRGEVVSGAEAMEIRSRTLDGREVDLSISAAPLRDRMGHLTGAVCVFRDQTERKRTEQALRESEARFHSMADTAPVLLWVAGPDGLVTFVNAPWLRFTGRHLEQEMGHGWAEGVHPDDYQPCLQTYLTALQARQPFTMEYRLRRFDGEYRWIVDTGVPRPAPDGSLLGYIGSAIDITDNKRLEIERAEARASELAQREVTRHMEEFLAIAAHDLRSPVTTVMLSVDMAQRRVQRLAAAITSLLPSATGNRPATLGGVVLAALATLERANAAVQRLARLIARLFDVAQARTGTLEIQRTACDLAAVVRAEVAAQRLAAPDHSIALDLGAATSAPVPVLADSDRLGQVLANYLTNALKYAPDDQPVRVTLEVRAGQARVAVRDAGPGLPPEEQARVWELFHRAPGVTAQSSTAGSMGLGLYICKRLVELHGGQVGVASAVGEGSTFWFTIPLADAAATDPPAI
jgi:PAS domain S-box-containing protein